ncbi:MAG: hypothetical protein WDN06_15205 [Asticcacaulis sp.]
MTLNFAVAAPVNRLKIDLYVPEDFGPQQVRVHINGDDYGLCVPAGRPDPAPPRYPDTAARRPDPRRARLQFPASPARA